jgi:hypothetical protein
MAEPSPAERFQTVLDIANRQIKENKILIRFGPSGKLRFVIDENGLKDALVSSGIDDETFRQIFHNEIGPILEAIIQNRPDQFQRIPFVAEMASDPKAREQRLQIVSDRAPLVADRLLSPELRARYLIKISSKHPRLKGSSWEVLTKLKLSTKEEMSYPYTTLSLDILDPIRETDMGIFAWILPEFGRTESIAFDCDEGDLDDLIHLLKEAKAALQESRKGT